MEEFIKSDYDVKINLGDYPRKKKKMFKKKIKALMGLMRFPTRVRFAGEKQTNKIDLSKPMI